MLAKKKNIFKKILYFIIIVGTLILGLSISDANAKYVIASQYSFDTDTFAQILEICEMKGCQLKGNLVYNSYGKYLQVLMDCPYIFDYEYITEKMFEYWSHDIEIKLPQDISKFL
jgi:hypothetical protein